MNETQPIQLYCNKRTVNWKILNIIITINLIRNGNKNFVYYWEGKPSRKKNSANNILQHRSLNSSYSCTTKQVQHIRAIVDFVDNNGWMIRIIYFIYKVHLKFTFESKPQSAT